MQKETLVKNFAGSYPALFDPGIAVAVFLGLAVAIKVAQLILSWAVGLAFPELTWTQYANAASLAIFILAGVYVAVGYFVAGHYIKTARERTGCRHWEEITWKSPSEASAYLAPDGKTNKTYDIMLVFSSFGLPTLIMFFVFLGILL